MTETADRRSTAPTGGSDAGLVLADHLASSVTSVSGNMALALDDPDRLWVVSSGEALVFAEDAGRARSAAPRPRHLVTARQTGEVVAAVDGHEVARRWVLTSPTTCTVATLSLADLQRAVDAGERGAGLLAERVTRWIRQAGGPPPVLGAGPVEHLAATRGDLARLEVERLERELAAEGELVEASEREVARASELALDRLGAVFDKPSRRRPAGGGDELLAAYRLVGRANGVSVEAPHPVDLERATAIEAIAQASRVRARPVALPPGWWSETGPALIGFRHDGTPVALLGRRRGYDLVDPVTGARDRVDKSAAAGLRLDAVELVRPLPEGPLTTRVLLRFAMLGTKRDLARTVVLAFVMGILALIPALATRLVFGSIVPESQTGRLVALTAGLIGVAFGTLFFQLSRGIALLRARTRIDHALQMALWDRLLRLPVWFHRRYQIGDLAERSMVVDRIRGIVTETVIVTFLAGVFGLFNLAVMVAIDARLAFVGLLVTGTGAAVLFVIARVYRRHQEQMLRGRREMASIVHELLTGIVKLRTAGAERRMFARWASRYAGESRLAYETYRINDLRVVFEGAFPTAMVLVLFVTVALIGRDAVPASAFLGFYVALGQLQTAVVGIARSMVSFLEARPVLEQARPILDESPEAQPSREHPGRLQGAFELRSVTFTYPGTTRPIFDGLSVRIDPGEFVAVVGPSGSGKSTLLRLLLGFERVDGGTVTIDGVDVEQLDMEAVRRQMGVVLQQTALLPGSVFDNIVGSAPLSTEDAWEAARQAGFDRDVERLPDGMATQIGDGVGILSGGQRQRLQIARALAGRPRVLLLDEATSALDNLTQRAVTETVERLDLTRVVIAHRLSTIASADRVIVIAGGRVVQDGPYRELADTPGPFADLVARQRL